MLKTKRKNTEADAGSPKKKKVQFNESKDDLRENKSFKTKKNAGKVNQENGTSKFNKPNKGFKNNKHDPKFKTGDKENKVGFKTKGNFAQNKGKFGKTPNAKGKQNFVKDKFSKAQEEGEKPKWAEMKKEKKNLRLIRRKAKATAEIFEISHKAKLLSAQIQR